MTRREAIDLIAPVVATDGRSARERAASVLNMLTVYGLLLCVDDPPALTIAKAVPPQDWCPVCHRHHADPGVKTDAGELVTPCPRLGRDDPRNWTDTDRERYQEAKDALDNEGGTYRR